MHTHTSTTPLADSDRFDLDTGLLCFDFVNTVDLPRDANPRDHLRGYDDLVAFAGASSVIPADAIETLLTAARRRPADAETLFHRAVAVREAIFGVFSRIATGNRPAADDLALLNAALADAMSHSRLVEDGDGYRWDWDDHTDLGRPLWPILRSAADTLTLPARERERIRICANPECGWLFVDTSRNHSRRWCSMQSCGNRAKVQQFRARQRAAAG